MISSLVVLHVILMVASLITTGVSSLATFAGHHVPRSMIASNTFITIAGVACGLVLMISLPLDVRCVVLFGYVIAFIAAQSYVLRRNQSLSPEA